MEPNGEKFLSESEIKERSTAWQEQVRKNETPLASGGNPYAYFHDRQEGGGDHSSKQSIDQAHGVSFIGEVIPEMIEKKHQPGKLKILDVGAGIGVFTDQIRKNFGDQVEVFSTGLSKKAARSRRKQNPNDLKWRSVSELSDYEEFDLIIDTYGEAFYLLADIDLKNREKK